MNHGKFKIALTAATLVVAFLPPISHAGVINSLFGMGLNTMQDQDAERILGATGGIKTSGTYAVGDIIEAVLRFDTVNAASISDSLPSPYQFTAYSQLQITSIDALSGGDIRLHFGASGNLGAGVMVALYERTSALQPGYDATVAPTTGIANIVGQTLISQLGLNGIDDFWNARTVNDIGILSSAAAGSGQASQGEFGISVVGFNTIPVAINGIMSPIDLKMHDFVGDASVYSRENGVNAGWGFSSNINASFNRVPEPATLALMGLGLLGMGVNVRKKRRSV